MVLSSQADRVLILAVIGIAVLTFSIGKVIYNIFFHPLRKYPGPFICHATEYYRQSKFMGGRLPQWLKDLHEVYGPVIRIAPNELSFTEPEAWKDIYSPLANMGKLREFAKYNKFYGFMGPKTADNILNAGFDEHIHLRRQVAPFFSTRNLQQREPLLRRYMDLLMDRLHQECCNGAKPLNLRDWFTFYTFDVIGNLGFGSDFDCLRDSKYHPWVRALTKNLKEYRWIQLLMYLGLDKLVHLITNSAFLRAKIIHENLTKDKLRESLKMERDSNDLLEALVTLDNPALPFEKLHSNMALIIIAGSETTATLLVSIVSMLADHPEVQQRLAKEVRSAFSNEDDITLAKVNNLDYLLACINECMRMFPPAAIGPPRVTPNQGVTIAGNFVPPKTIVAVAQWAAYRDPDNFTRPLEFLPERWMGASGFEKDRQDVFQPFGFGHRDCIARNLAHVESRLVVARLIYNFDIKVDASNSNWGSKQRSWLLWDKQDFMATLEPVRKH